MTGIISYMLLWPIFLFGCQSPESNRQYEADDIIPEEYLLCDRFSPPQNAYRASSDSSSFTFYLRHLPLKPHGTEVRTYSGAVKSNNNIYAAVVDLPIGSRDLHQCADAVMRLRAEYLYAQQRYDEIHFNFTNGFNCEYAKWRKGFRVRINGNNAHWVKVAEPTDSEESFWKYLEMVWSFAGTWSLEQELVSRPFEKMQIGDVLIQGGSPGHAVIVVDMALDSLSNQKYFMLAQSYMPAQELQILVNRNNNQISPWYLLDDQGIISTPEWRFEQTDLKAFSED